LPADFASGCRSDLVTIDGAPVTVRVSGSIADAFAGRPATVEPCAASAVDLGAGEHVVRSAAGTATGLDVDQIVLRSAGRGAADGGGPTAARPQATVTDNGRIDRTVTVDACPDGCWFVFGEGYNEGWSASVDGSALGPQQQVDGGFNGWYLPPSDHSRTVHLRWNGQSRLTLGIALSAVGALACLAMVVLDRRRRDPLAVTTPTFVRFRVPAPDRRTFALSGPAAIATATALVAGTLVVSPSWGLVCGAIAAVCGFGLRRVAVIGLVAVAMVGGVSLIMIRRFLVLKPFVNAGWPGIFEDLHRPAMAAIVLLAVSIVARPGAVRTRGAATASDVGSHVSESPQQG
jgi:hypothetical protein